MMDHPHSHQQQQQQQQQYRQHQGAYSPQQHHQNIPQLPPKAYQQPQHHQQSQPPGAGSPLARPETIPPPASQGVPLHHGAVSNPGQSAHQPQPLPEQGYGYPQPQALAPLQDDEIAAAKAAAQQRFAAQLRSDHARILQPDYCTPFTSATDVVSRLLPYHIFHIPDEDLQHALGDADRSLRGTKRKRAGYGSEAEGEAEPARKRIVGDESGAPSVKEESNDGIKQDGAADISSLPASLPSGSSDPDPDPEASLFAAKSFARRCVLHSRLRALRIRLDTPRSPTTQVEQFERLAMEAERTALTEEQSALRTLRAQLDAQSRAQLDASNQSAGSSGSASGPSRPSSHIQGRWPGTPGAPSRGPGRPRLHSPAGSPTGSPYPPSPGTGTPRAQSYRPRPPGPGQSPGSSGPNAGRPHRPVGPGTRSSGAPNPPPHPSIPSQPIPLLIPLHALPRLSALGIHPLPAPHLLAAGFGSPGGPGAVASGSMAPRAPPPEQKEAALLLGVSEDRTGASGHGQGQGHGQNAHQQVLHISVVLSKLAAQQLAGLAQLMSSLQNESAPPPAPPSNPGTGMGTGEGASASGSGSGPRAGGPGAGGA